MNEGGAALVTGASGFIGRTLVERLADSGQRVLALTRNPANRFPSGVEVKVGDLATGAGVSTSLVENVDRVFHCAGEVRRPGLMRQVHVRATDRLLQCLRDTADRRGRPAAWIQLSSVGAYGPASTGNRCRRVDEESRENPVGEYEVTKTEADHLVGRAAQDGLISCTTLRPSNVIGVRMSNAALRRVISMVTRGWFVYVGPPGAVANYVHVDDVASALIACATPRETSGDIFNLSSDCLWEALIERVAALCGVRPPRLRVPQWPLRALAATVGARFGNPLSATAIDALVNRTRYPVAKIESRLGFRFARPMPDAVEDLITHGA